MSKQYYTVLTTYGSQQFAAAMANNRPLNITHFAVGDGNGRAIQPDSSRTALVRQVHKAAVSSISVDPRNNKQIIFELTLPETVGGFWVREMGLFDSQNRLIAHANCPDSYKPLLADGSGKIQILRMILLVSSSNAVSLTVDNRVIWATRNQLTPKKITATSTNQVTDDGHTHEIDLASLTTKGLVQLTNDTGLDSESLALTAKGAKALAQLIAAAQQLAAGKWTAVDATTVRKGITQLNSSINNTSESQAATPKAVKTAYDKAVAAQNTADGKLSKSGDNATGDYTFDGNITQTGRERTIESNYRVRVKRNHPNYNPYMQVLNENIVEAANNREIGNYAFVIKNAEDVEITKAMLQARILEDKNATVEMALWDADQTKLIPWKVFSETNNTVFGATADNAKGRVQVHGNLWSSEAPIIENPTKWRAFNKRVADGMWTVDFAAVGSADKRFNFGFIPDDGSATTYLRFPKLTKDEVAAYQSWVLANAILQDGANEITGSLMIRSKNNSWSGIRLATKNGMWLLEANPNDDDKRLNLKHVGADGVVRYIAFPAANDKNERVAYESWVREIFAPLVNPSFVGTLQTDYRAVVERNTEGYPPYTMLINSALNAEQPKNAVIGEHNHYVKNSKGDVVGKAQWRTNLWDDGNTTTEMALWDANQVKRIPWKAFATTNNTVFGKTTDDGVNRVQINGTATVTAPAANADNNQVPTTGWVNNKLASKSIVAVLTGEIAHGGTIPLPSGFTAAQCKWMVSSHRQNPSSESWDWEENGAHMQLRTECYANASRVVTARMYVHSHGTSQPRWINGTANYIIIGVKN